MIDQNGLQARVDDLAIELMRVRERLAKLERWVDALEDYAATERKMERVSRFSEEVEVVGGKGAAGEGVESFE